VGALKVQVRAMKGYGPAVAREWEETRRRGLVTGGGAARSSASASALAESDSGSDNVWFIALSTMSEWKG
jgi:hypothetical protein